MAVEQRRGCGYRKVGGLYLVSGGAGQDCDRIPIPLDVCPVCSHGFKQARGWTWTDLAGLVGGNHDGCKDEQFCPLCLDVKAMGKAGLLWIGEKFYKTPADFTREGCAMGFSRRIHAIPRGFKVGETWVLLAHPKTIQETCERCIGNGYTVADELKENRQVQEKCGDCGGSGKTFAPAIFTVWRPSRVEKLFKESDRDSQDVKDAIEKGITPVFVPDDDKDHQGSVYDKAEEEEETEVTA
jgi:hypothetical protein